MNRFRDVGKELLRVQDSRKDLSGYEIGIAANPPFKQIKSLPDDGTHAFHSS